MSANRLGLCRSVNDLYVATVCGPANTAKNEKLQTDKAQASHTSLLFDGDSLLTPSPHHNRDFSNYYYCHINPQSSDDVDGVDKTRRSKKEQQHNCCLIN